MSNKNNTNKQEVSTEGKAQQLAMTIGGSVGFLEGMEAERIIKQREKAEK